MSEQTKAPLRWSDLLPEPGMLGALQHAGDKPVSGNQDQKRDWSARLANGCAVAIADALRGTPLSKKKTIRPESIEKGTEPLTPLGSGSSKRIDVTVVDPILGLEVGVSLKGLNFRDARSNNHDKNLTGRLYELGDEVRVVHEHLPHAFMVGVFFLPLESTVDKSTKAISSFAHTAIALRARSGRLDASLMMHAPRCDAAYVGLYSGGDGNVPLGVVRFFEVIKAPPRRGRPLVSETVGLRQLATDIAVKATFGAELEWGVAEQDAEYSIDTQSTEDAIASDMEELLSLELEPDIDSPDPNSPAATDADARSGGD